MLFGLAMVVVLAAAVFALPYWKCEDIFCYNVDDGCGGKLAVYEDCVMCCNQGSAGSVWVNCKGFIDPMP